MPPKRRRRFQGLYYHSSPPKVLPMNDQLSNQNGRRRRDVDDFSIKLSTIRIWMHEKDIGKLTRILWAGQGNRLRQQASTNTRVKRFLAAVPYVMNAIKDVHQSVIDNNLETLQAKLEPPVPPALITGKDANGLNVIHKAAGLGHTKMLEYLISVWPEGANETDITGKTPLHWAASAKNNMRCYTLLTQAGCDEEAVDYKSKTPSYYRHKPQEIERAFLVYVPEAPRVSPDIATDWDAISDENSNDSQKKAEIKIPLTNGINGRSNEDSLENTSEVDLNDGISANDEDDINGIDKINEPEENGNATAPVSPETQENEEENGNDEEQTEEDNKEENNANTINETTVNGTNEAEETTETNETSEVESNEIEKENEAEGDVDETEVTNGIEKEDETNEADNIEVDENHNSKKVELNGELRDENQIETDEKNSVEVISKNDEEDGAENDEGEIVIKDDENADKTEYENEADATIENEEEPPAEVDENNEAEAEMEVENTDDDDEHKDNNENEDNEENEEEVVVEPNENREQAESDNDESEKTDNENAINEVAVNVEENNLEDAIPAHLREEYEKKKANKIIKQDQETGEKICLPKPIDEIEVKQAQKQNSDNGEEDDDEVQFGTL